jgi:hypothetical protein
MHVLPTKYHHHQNKTEKNKKASLAADGAKGWSALLAELQAIQGGGGGAAS